jgi:predicted subunit of tRNA(5-methylaminomethyl-2-thiouridylate) methyltransferase
LPNVAVETLDVVKVILVQLQEKRVDQTQRAPLFTVSVAQSLERRNEDLDACRPLLGVGRLVDVVRDLCRLWRED